MDRSDSRKKNLLYLVPFPILSVLIVVCLEVLRDAIHTGALFGYIPISETLVQYHSELTI